jgi:hypothetical protein
MNGHFTIHASGSKRKQIGFKVFFSNYLNQLRNLHELRITKFPDTGFLVMFCKRPKALLLNRVTTLTVHCDDLKYLLLCPNVGRLKICCSKRKGRCYLEES